MMMVSKDAFSLTFVLVRISVIKCLMKHMREMNNANL